MNRFGRKSAKFRPARLPLRAQSESVSFTFILCNHLIGLALSADSLPLQLSLLMIFSNGRARELAAEVAELENLNLSELAGKPASQPARATNRPTDRPAGPLCACSVRYRNSRAPKSNRAGRQFSQAAWLDHSLASSPN